MSQEPVPEESDPDRAGDHELRRRARAARRALTTPARAHADAAIAAALLSLDELTGVVSLGWYLPTDGEVDLSHAVDALVDRGVQLHLPVLGDGRSMSFVAWRPGAPMTANRFGIDEPVGGAGVSAAALDAVVVPSVAVDAHGHRLGFGAGYYDRALAGSGAVRIGVVFDVQVVERIEPQPWDVPLDVVITESGVLRPGRPRR